MIKNSFIVVNENLQCILDLLQELLKGGTEMTRAIFLKLYYYWVTRLSHLSANRAFVPIHTVLSSYFSLPHLIYFSTPVPKPNCHDESLKVGKWGGWKLLKHENIWHKGGKIGLCEKHTKNAGHIEAIGTNSAFIYQLNCAIIGRFLCVSERRTWLRIYLIG